MTSIGTKGAHGAVGDARSLVEVSGSADASSSAASCKRLSVREALTRTEPQKKCRWWHRNPSTQCKHSLKTTSSFVSGAVHGVRRRIAHKHPQRWP